MKVLNESNCDNNMSTDASFVSATSDEKSSSLSYSLSHLQDGSPIIASVGAIAPPVPYYNNTSDNKNENRRPTPIVKTAAAGTALAPMLSTPITTATTATTKSFSSMDTPTQTTTTNNFIQDLNSTMNTAEEQSSNSEIKHISGYYSSLINSEKNNSTENGQKDCKHLDPDNYHSSYLQYSNIPTPNIVNTNNDVNVDENIYSESRSQYVTPTHAKKVGVSAEKAGSENGNNMDIEEQKKNNASSSSSSKRMKMNSVVDRLFGNDRANEDDDNDFDLVLSPTQRSCTSGISAISFDEEAHQKGLKRQKRRENLRLRRQRCKLCCYVSIPLFLLIALVFILVTLYFVDPFFHNQDYHDHQHLRNDDGHTSNTENATTVTLTVTSSDVGIFSAMAVAGNNSIAITPTTTSLAQDVSESLNEKNTNDNNVNNQEPLIDIIENPMHVHQPSIVANDTIDPNNFTLDNMNVTAEEIYSSSNTIASSNMTVEVNNNINITNSSDSSANDANSQPINNYETDDDVYSNMTVVNNSTILNISVTTHTTLVAANVTEDLNNDTSAELGQKQEGGQKITNTTIKLHNITVATTSTNVTPAENDDTN